MHVNNTFHLWLGFYVESPCRSLSNHLELIRYFSLSISISLPILSLVIFA